MIKQTLSTRQANAKAPAKQTLKQNASKIQARPRNYLRGYKPPVSPNRAASHARTREAAAAPEQRP